MADPDALFDAEPYRVDYPYEHRVRVLPEDMTAVRYSSDGNRPLWAVTPRGLHCLTTTCRVVRPGVDTMREHLRSHL